MTKFVGGPFDGQHAQGNETQKLWVTRYTRNGTPWTPPYGMFYQNFPPGVTGHEYRKQQKTGNLHYVKSRT